MTEVRLQKVIANSGVASRRKAEEMIRLGDVQVNGRIVTEMGVKVDPTVDTIKVMGKVINKIDAGQWVFVLYKPKSCVSTMSDPEGRDCIKHYLPNCPVRLFPVGRLDYDAEGLLLLTNDGDFANKMAHPSEHVWKTYLVKVKGRIEHPVIKKISKGPMIDGVRRQPVKIRILHYLENKTWLEVQLQEGIKHHIKKMFSTVDFPVQKIKRVSFGPLSLDEMQPRDIRRLEKSEIDALLEATAK